MPTEIPSTAPARTHAAAGKVAACPSCRGPMEALELWAHYGKKRQVDVCGRCHMLWFDGHESVNVSGRGVLNLLRAIEASHAREHLPIASVMQCPRCHIKLQRSANLTALGPTAQHECPRGHGAAQSFSLYLAEKGFVRPLYRPEVEQLRKRPEDRQTFVCLNCGAPLDPRQREACSYCASPVKVIDFLNLLRTVDRQTGQLSGAAVTGARRSIGHITCPHCGQAADPSRDRRCSGCAMPVALTDLKQALALLEPFAPAIEAETATPDYRRQRLAEALDRAPVGIPPSRPAHGYQQPAWVYMAVGAVMLSLLALVIALVWLERR